MQAVSVAENPTVLFVFLSGSLSTGGFLSPIEHLSPVKCCVEGVDCMVRGGLRHQCLRFPAKCMGSPPSGDRDACSPQCGLPFFRVSVASSVSVIVF